MAKEKIFAFEWDNAKGEDYNGKHLMIGQHLPKAQNHEFSHVEIYGISLDIADEAKDWRLKRIGAFSNNCVTEVKEVTKEEARKMLIEQIDKALGIMFNQTEMGAVDRDLNQEAWSGERQEDDNEEEDDNEDNIY